MVVSLINIRLLTVVLGSIFLLVSAASAQNNNQSKDPEENPAELAATRGASSEANPAVPSPSFADYKGVTIGMPMKEVRSKLDHLKEKGQTQDFFEFSEKETAAIYYDKDGNVTAVTVDYTIPGTNPPSPVQVLGEDIAARDDGSIYQLKRYPSAGYWVSYNRTAGDPAIVTVTMQKMN